MINYVFFQKKDVKKRQKLKNIVLHNIGETESFQKNTFFKILINGESVKMNMKKNTKQRLLIHTFLEQIF